MLIKFTLIFSVVCFYASGKVIAAYDEEAGSGLGGGDDETDEETSSGGGAENKVWAVPTYTSTVRHHNQQPYKNVYDEKVKEPELTIDNADAEEDEEGTEEDEDDEGGEGIIIDETEDEENQEQLDGMMKEPLPAQENSLITHPGILAAIIIGGILVVVCLVLFFVLIIFCVRKKDEGTYDLDKAMKEKLKHITYTKAETSEKEFFA